MPKTNGISKRETEVLSCIAQGYNYNEITNILIISPSTVGKSIPKIFTKNERFITKYKPFEKELKKK